jgi:hypothetical protein
MIQQEGMECPAGDISSLKRRAPILRTGGEILASKIGETLQDHQIPTHGECEQ